MARWLGVDVGGRRKAFDAAVVDERSVLWIGAGLSTRDVLAAARRYEVRLAGVDAPCACAPGGERSRAAERELAVAVCHIRYTPDEREVRMNPFHEWVARGLDLHRRLAACGVSTIEVFPTASFTRWVGKRGGRSRAAWSTEAIALLKLGGVPVRTSQDTRDAIAAAATARQYERGECELFAGEIAVPLEGL